MRDFLVKHAFMAYPVYRKMKKHLLKHGILAKEDFERIIQEEREKQKGKDVIILMGGLDIEHLDLTPPF